MNGYDPLVQAAQMRAEWEEMLDILGRFNWPPGTESERDETRQAMEKFAEGFVALEVYGPHLTEDERETFRADAYELLTALVEFKEDVRMLMDRIAAFRREGP